MHFGGIEDRVVYSAGYPKNAFDGKKLVYATGKKGNDQNGIIHFPSNPLEQVKNGSLLIFFFFYISQTSWHKTRITEIGPN